MLSRRLFRALRTPCASHQHTRLFTTTTTPPNDEDNAELEAALQNAPSSSSSGKISPITSRGTDFSRWYHDVIAQADLIDSSPVRGCMVLRPNGFAIWESIQQHLDKDFKRTGHKNVYFPLLIPQSFLCREAQHVDGFAKECAVVTHHRLCTVQSPDGNAPPTLQPDPTAVLPEPLIVRPTSETMVWSLFSRWIKSYRDLPLLTNQWANVVRWEMRCRPFLRTSEFLWQEGHTAHATEQDALQEAKQMLQIYRRFCEDVLGVPVVCGVKSESERFAGALETFTIEALMQDGRALQSGTSHFLGQNFAKAFNVKFADTDGERKFVWATSWGVSTRLIGAVIMTHSDDKGLVLPPRVAPVQVVVVPIGTQPEVLDCAKRVKAALNEHNPDLRVELDDRPQLKPGNKYHMWERQGVPLRIEIGARDVSNGVVTCAPRVSLVGADSDSGTDQTMPQKIAVVLGNSNTEFAASIGDILAKIQGRLLENARAATLKRTFNIATYDQLKQMVASQDTRGFYVAPWADSAENEAKIKEDCKVTIRCYPLEMQDKVNGQTCFFSGKPATHIALLAQAY